MSRTSIAPLGKEFPLPELITRFQQEWGRWRDSVDGPVTRVTSFNLLVVSHGQDEETLQKVVDGLDDSHPARLIWIRVENDRSWEDGRASLRFGCRCQGTQVCSEQVQICCGMHPERTTSIVLPLIRTGLSTHLIWWKRAPDRGYPLFERLADRCKLVLFEEDSWSELCQRLVRVWWDPMRQEHNFMPLSWFRLLEVRQQIAAAYGEGKEIEIAIAPDLIVEFNLLKLWVATLLPGEETDTGFVGERLTLKYGEPGTGITIEQGITDSKVCLPIHLQGVRVALNRPGRDPVFGRMMERLKRRQ